MAFLVEFIRSPSQLSSLFPTHPEIGRSMVRGLDLARAKAVAELGPGTGTITRAVLEALRPGTAFFAVELNARLAGLFRRNFPEVRLFEGDAANLRAYCDQLDVRQLDAVVSALPWTTIPRVVRGKIVDAAARSLKPGGIMTWVTYRSPKMKSVRMFNDELRCAGFRVGEATVVREALVRAHVFHCVLER
ncbi:MAG: methyltransferase domain-containing protein [Phycisphaerales bacterium]|nr:methyltransferase domain-containing protein [Phycisphaerales bacterium]